MVDITLVLHPSVNVYCCIYIYIYQNIVSLILIPEGSWGNRSWFDFKMSSFVVNSMCKLLKVVFTLILLWYVIFLYERVNKWNFWCNQSNSHHYVSVVKKTAVIGLIKRYTLVAPARTAHCNASSRGFSIPQRFFELEKMQSCTESSSFM